MASLNTYEGSFSLLLQFVKYAGGTWGMKRSGANEDTSSLPVISVLDAELTYLQFLYRDPKRNVMHAN